ncbi:hypothetical protein VT50_0206005 [Streptomyces antioxidans]|uniref:Uncharacterized protein n=1 Tax=Streptomyces antioxidans TaxID=1507734 RepID=A0A1V4DAG4_9ACTN|nr:hypothetical protein VT50_0206005 [Streptomyces antioxidans]
MDGVSTYLALTFGTLLSSQGTDASFETVSPASPGASLRCFQPYQTRFPTVSDPNSVSDGRWRGLAFRRVCDFSRRSSAEPNRLHVMPASVKRCSVWISIRLRSGSDAFWGWARAAHHNRLNLPPRTALVKDSGQDSLCGPTGASTRSGHRDTPTYGSVATRSRDSLKFLNVAGQTG